METQVVWNALVAWWGWTWPDDTGHMWEARSPHLSYIRKYLKIEAFVEETS
jgi:hypothetical protein